MNVALEHRLATLDDLDALQRLMHAAIDELQRDHLDREQIAASHQIMGVDTALIEDRTYFVVLDETGIVGCGGWSRRATLYGGDQSPGRNATLLDPATDAARIRAMYTHPLAVRRGIGRTVLELCEQAARGEGFHRVELMATKAGQPLYTACGFVEIEPVVDTSTGVSIPLVRMGKRLR